jgi:short chain dehydrogenase
MRFNFENCYKKLVARAGIAPKGARPGLAYAISKHFVIWFAKTDAARFGAKNVRCLSVTPGNFDTPMGALESEQAEVFKKYSALKRNGRPEEIAALFAMLIDERLGFLTGTDIIMDGGLIASGASGLSR